MRKNDILKYLADEDKIEILSELLDAIKESKKKNNLSAIEECIYAWGETAKLNSIPNFREKVWSRFNKLKKAGLING
jgi:hypothetical protein